MKKRMLFFLLALGIVLLACSGGDVVGGALDGVVAIKNRKIAGVTQKGPFLTGSSVTIQELDGRTLAQTGKSFKAFVKSNQGDFAIKGVSLVSQYAMLEVEGYFRNEIAGKSSDGKIRLNALTDLRKRNHVNVNLLTHLESGRILNLVQKHGLSVDAARKQAEQELFTSFGFMNENAVPEDMDIFSEKNGGAMLLAVSVLMLQDSSTEADFSERMSRAAFAFAENGTWSGTDRAEIADWAVYSEVANGSDLSVLQRTRKNLESWNESVPPFETYINLFWSNEYGLGPCSDANFHEVRPNINENSLFYLDEFVCNSSHRWSLIAYRENAGDINVAGVYWAPRNVGCEKQKSHIGYDPDFPDKVLRKKKMEKKQCITYGGYFYEYDALSVCPDGYRLPTAEEAQALIDAYGGSEKAAVGLRSVDGFAAVMSGYFVSRYYSPYSNPDEYVGVHKVGEFWISTSIMGDRYILKIDSNGASFAGDYGAARPVRCVRNF